MKRNLLNSYQPVAKRTRSQKPVLTTGFEKKKRKLYIPWIAATKTRNFFFNDHLVDWLKLYEEDIEALLMDLQIKKHLQIILKKKE